MGIRDLAADAAVQAANSRQLAAKVAEEQRRRLVTQAATEWCTKHLLPPDEVIVQKHDYHGNSAIVRIDDVWLRWSEDPNKNDHYSNDHTPGVRLVHLIERRYQIKNEKLASHGEWRTSYQWEEILASNSYDVIRSLAALGVQLSKTTGAKSRYGPLHTVVDPNDHRDKLDPE